MQLTGCRTIAPAAPAKWKAEQEGVLFSVSRPMAKMDRLVKRNGLSCNKKPVLRLYEASKVQCS